MSGNPFLNEKSLQGAVATVGGSEAQRSAIPVAGAPSVTVTDTATRPMTYGGVTSATGLLLGFVFAGGWYGWGRVVVTSFTDAVGRTTQTASMPSGWLFGSMIVGFVLAIACSFKPNLAPVLAIPYALAEGVFLGIISRYYDLQTQGIVVQAVLATAGVFLVMLVLYSLRVLRATPRMVKGIMAATLGIGVMYFIGFIASLFGAGLQFWNSPSPLGIAISVVVVAVAAFNLILDFDMIERGVASGMPRKMEWFCAFGLVVTLVWLYLEMLRLLAKIQQR